MSKKPNGTIPELNNLYPNFSELPPGQQRILQSALVLFAEKGYASTSTRTIAQQAGVAEGLIFKHFRNKKDLLLKLVHPILSGLLFPLSVRRIRKQISVQNQSLETFLRSILTERMAFVKEHHHLVRLVLQELFLHPELMSKLQMSFEQNLQPLFMERLSEYQAQGQVRDMPFETFFRLLLSAFMGLIIPRVLLFPNYAWQEDLEIEETLQTLIQGLAPPGGTP